MKEFFVHKHALRSFRFLSYIPDMVKILKRKSNFFYIMLYKMQTPLDRIFLTKIFLEKNLIGKLLPKNILNFFFKQKKYLGLKNLFIGNIMYIKNKEDSIINKETLNFLLKKNVFFLRLIL